MEYDERKELSDAMDRIIRDMGPDYLIDCEYRDYFDDSLKLEHMAEAYGEVQGKIARDYKSCAALAIWLDLEETKCIRLAKALVLCGDLYDDDEFAKLLKEKTNGNKRS